MGREMNPIDFGDHPIQNGRLIGGQKVKFRHIATYCAIAGEPLEPVT